LEGDIGSARDSQGYLSEMRTIDSLEKVDWAGWEDFLDEMQYKDYGESNSNKSDFSRIPVLNVMLLGWRGDMAHRIGLGQVWLKRWVQSEPKLKAIVLE
jgi:hypothetical protein